MSVNFGDPYLTVPSADPVKWGERWDIEPFTTECKDCGRLKNACIPWASKYRRGFLAEPCECGSDASTFTFIDLRFGPGEVPMGDGGLGF